MNNFGQKVLEVKNLKKFYGHDSHLVEALVDVSFSLERGQFTSLMGPSGGGKSSLLHLIGGLDRPSQGSVCINNKCLDNMTDNQLSAFRRQHLGFIFQFFYLLPTLTALENVALPCLIDGQSLTEVSPRAIELLSMIGLAHRIHHRPDQLSGGEMQRVAIARALVTDPLLIVADEPTGNLDSKTGALVLELLQTMARDQGHTILMATHDANAASYADRQITIRDGMIESDKRTRPVVLKKIHRSPQLDAPHREPRHHV
ncbi:MAG: ABC transporter ATP-binding protein [Bdellovibrionota bacterium]